MVIAFRALTGARLPIVQAPMAGAAGVALAVAAIRGGAVGSLPCALLSPEQIGAQVAQVREQASGPLALNFFCHRMPAPPDERAWRALLQPYYARFKVAEPMETGALRLPFDDAACAAVEAVRPEIVSFHFGLPAPDLLARVRASGALVFASVTSVAQARMIAPHVDAIVAQGFEAGGHASFWQPGELATHTGLFALVPQIVDATGLPVIAAGGIADARGLAAALMLGACAGQIGTAYLHCPESFISDAHRAALTSEAAERTRFTNLISGGLARGLPGLLDGEIGPIRSEAPPFPYASAALAPLRKAAEARGELGFSPAWAGQAARLGRAEPAEALTRRVGDAALAMLVARA